MIMDLKRNLLHAHCRVFDTITNEEIICEYADDHIGIVRGLLNHAAPGEMPDYRLDQETGKTIRFERRGPIRIEYPRGVSLLSDPSLTLEVHGYLESQQTARKALGVIHREDGRIDWDRVAKPMTHPDYHDRFAMECITTPVGNTGMYQIFITFRCRSA